MMKSLFTLLPNCIVINTNMKHVFIVYFQDYNLYINLVIMMENWYHVVLQLGNISFRCGRGNVLYSKGSIIASVSAIGTIDERYNYSRATADDSISSTVTSQAISGIPSATPEGDVSFETSLDIFRIFTVRVLSSRISKKYNHLKSRITYIPFYNDKVDL
jgi:hypothetical protein